MVRVVRCGNPIAHARSDELIAASNGLTAVDLHLQMDVDDDDLVDEEVVVDDLDEQAADEHEEEEEKEEEKEEEEEEDVRITKNVPDRL